MKNTNKTIVIVVDIADTDALKKALGESENPDIFPQRVVRPVSNGLQRLCSENRATLSNKVNPFVVEAADAKDVLNIVRSLISPNEGGFRVTIPGSTDPVQFYIGISCRSQHDDEDEFRSLAHARALAGGAGPNEIKIEREAAELLVDVEMDDLEILFLGSHRILDEKIPKRIFQLRPHLELKPTGEEKGEIVRLTLTVIDILHSTNLKPLMGSTQEERLKNYDQKILKPFRVFTADLAKQHGGVVVDQTGDSCFLSFPDPDQARQWAIAILGDDYRIPAPEGYEWPEVRYHLSIDSGRVMRNSQGLLQGNFVDRVHRLNDLSQDNQIILSPSVATALQEELLDEGADGRVHRHEAVSLQGIVEDVEVWEYCPPGIEPRQPRKGKGQTQLKPAALAAISAPESLAPFAREVERHAEHLNGKEARVASKFRDNTRIFAFDRVLDGVRFLIDIRRASKEQIRGALHYGLVIEKSDGLLDGSSAADTVALLPATDQPGTIRMSGSAATHVSDRNNRRFRIRHIEGASVKLRDQVESVYEVISKMPLTLQYLRTVAAVLAVAVLGELLFSQFVRSPRQKDQALFVSLSPALDGQSWWFDISPWFTPEMRRKLYRDRGGSIGLKKLKASMLNSGQAFQFYEDLKKSLPKDRDSIPWSLDSQMAEGPMDRSACYGIIAKILKVRSGDDIEATDWHLIANLLTSLNPSRKDKDDPEFRNQHEKVLTRFGNRPGRQNDYFRAVFAFKQADDGYQKTRFEKDRDILTGLQALCAADKAWLYFSRREMKDCEKSLDRAVGKLEEVENENLLKVFILSLRGETKVRLYSQDRTTDNITTNENPDSDFDQAMATLKDCFPSLHGGNTKSVDHLFGAAINQRRAHYYLETWKLAASEKCAEKAREIREEENKAKPNNESPDSKSANAALERKIYLEYVRCQLLEALAAQFSGNARNAENALRNVIEISSRLENWNYVGAEQKELLSNSHQRLADFCIFVSGDLEKAIEQLEKATKIAVETGWDKPTHQYHIRYIDQVCRLAWMYAIEGEREQGRRELESLQTSNRFAVGKAESPLYFKVASAFTEENPDLKLKLLIEEIKDNDSITRDERQLLFLVCEYLRKGELSQEERNIINLVYEKLSEPWTEKGEIGSEAYLYAIRHCAAVLRKKHIASLPFEENVSVPQTPEAPPN